MFFLKKFGIDLLLWYCSHSFKLAFVLQLVNELIKMAYEYYDDVALPKLVLFNSQSHYLSKCSFFKLYAQFMNHCQNFIR